MNMTFVSDHIAIPRSEQMERRLKKLMKFIVAYKITHDGNSPTNREMGAALNVRSTSLIKYYVDELANRSLIKTSGEGSSRSIQVIGGSWRPPKLTP
jgi:SOS-response transcriptional repressor LexA